MILINYNNTVTIWISIGMLSLRRPTGCSQCELEQLIQVGSLGDVILI
jgi:hypothetical protein